MVLRQNRKNKVIDWVLGGPSIGRNDWRKIAHAHLRHMNPFPAELGDIVKRFPKIFVPEINLGQLSKLIRAEFLVDARSYGKLFGVPFQAADLEQRILEMIES